MKTVLQIALATATTAVGLVAQKDVITWTNGEKTEKCTVTAFNLREIKFRSGGSTETRSSDKVADLSVEKVKDHYRRAYSSSLTERPGNFVRDADAAKKKGDEFTAQFGYVEAAQLLVDNGQAGEAFGVLEKLKTECGDSGFLPMLYRVKLDYYLGRGRKGDSVKVANDYWTATQTEGYPPGFGLEANYYKAVAQGLAGELNAGQLRTQMQTVATEAGAEFPDVASKARLQIAHTLRSDNKLDEASQEYRELLDADFAPPAVLAGAWLGMGHVHFASGDPTNKEPYREALLAFLHVYLDSENAPKPVLAEAIDMAAKSADKWGGAESSRMARRLRGLLRSRFPDYKSN